jgi:IS5 family transposase
MKKDGKLGRNYLKGVIGDKLNAILCGIGHNLRLMARKISHSEQYRLSYED